MSTNMNSALRVMYYLAKMSAILVNIEFIVAISMFLTLFLRFLINPNHGSLRSSSPNSNECMFIGNRSEATVIFSVITELILILCYSKFFESIKGARYTKIGRLFILGTGFLSLCNVVGLIFYTRPNSEASTCTIENRNLGDVLHWAHLTVSTGLLNCMCLICVPTSIHQLPISMIDEESGNLMNDEKCAAKSVGNEKQPSWDNVGPVVTIANFPVGFLLILYDDLLMNCRSRLSSIIYPGRMVNSEDLAKLFLSTR